MEDKNFIARGISKKTGDFVYGYYFKGNNKHYIIDPEISVPYTAKAKAVFEFGEQEYSREVLTRFIEITQEPDRFYKEVNGIRLFENDEIQYTVKGFHDTRDCIATETINILYEQEIDLVASIKSGEIADLKIIGNTHNIKPKE